ncbi:MAG TPA: secretin N-terminal domain-containing protein, partial [Armatimonadota bacterium]
MRVQHYGQFIRLLLGCLVILSLVPAISQTTEQAQPTAGTAGQPTATTGTAAPAAPPATGTAGQAAPATGTAEPTPAVTPAETSHRGIWDTGTTLGTSSMDLTNGQPVDYEKTLVSIAFAKADITNVLSFLSMTSGVPVVVDADVKGTVTIISMKRVSLTMAYQVINSALRVRGYTMIGTLKDKLIRVVTLKRAVSDHADVREGADPQNVGTSDNVVTQVVQLQNASASKLKDELKPLVADDQANLLAVTSSNMLIVTDTEGNVKRLLQIINLLDKDPNDVLDVEIYQCKFASASILTASLSKIFPITTSNTAAQGQNGQQPGQPQPGGRQGGNGASGPSVRTDDGVYSMKGEFRVAADDRTNSLIISASRQKINMVLAMVKKLDVDTTPAVKARIFPLKYADATLVATQLTKLFDSSSSSSSGNPFFRQFQPNASASTTSDGFIGFKQNTVVADVRTNSVVITATETNMREFEKMLTQLDTPNKLSDITRAFPLKFASASTLATTLTALFRGTTTSSRTSFADLFYGNNTQNQAGDPIATLKNITVVAET